MVFARFDIQYSVIAVRVYVCANAIDMLACSCHISLLNETN